MILARAPLRISYIGGGSDFKSFFSIQDGNVVSATIQQYVYAYLNPLSPLAEENVRFSYRITESVMSPEKLEHPLLREMLLAFRWKNRTNIGTFADLPSGAGLGGSSAFAVALGSLLFHYSGQEASKTLLAETAIDIERNRLNESGGYQDQYATAFGDFRHYNFCNSAVSASKPLLTEADLSYLAERQILVWMGGVRHSKSFASTTERNIRDKFEEFSAVSSLASKLASELQSQLSSSDKFSLICEAVRRGWELKQRFSDVNSERVAEILSLADQGGALAYKLCGAGGTGFVLILAHKDKLPRLKNALSSYTIIQPEFDTIGSCILINNQSKGTPLPINNYYSDNQ